MTALAGQKPSVAGTTLRLLSSGPPMHLQEDQVLAFVNRELSEEGRQKVEEHADRCSPCRRLLAEAARACSAPRVQGHGAATDFSIAEFETATREQLRGSRFGRFVLADRIGAGTMGVVFAAYDPDLDRKVALKLLRPSLTESAQGQSRLEREAKAMAQLSHPNVATVYEAGVVSSQPYLAMELVEGQSLRQWLAAEPRSVRAIVDKFLEAARGLAAAHSAGIIHRDFKPDNMLCGKDGRLRVSDFGLAHRDVSPSGVSPPLATADEQPLPKDATVSGTLLGTPAYMAPEQMVGGLVDARADQFAFAVALYEALYGERPFAGESLEALRRQIENGRLRTELKARRPRVPARLHRVLARALANEPERRFSSMDELIVAMTRATAPRWPRILAGLGATGLPALVVFQLVRPAPSLCDGAAERFARVWNDSRAQLVAQSFAAANAPLAKPALERVLATLADYGAAWVHAHREACLDARLRRVESEGQLAKRTACLERRLGQVDALAAIFSAADAKTVETAAQAVAMLGDLSVCADTRAQEATPVLPPESPPAREVARLRELATRAKALVDTGRPGEALRLLEGAEEAARVTGYDPAIAEVLAQSGAAHLELGGPKAAVRELRDAAFAAERGQDDDLAARLYLSLVKAYVSDRSRDELTEAYCNSAEASIARVRHQTELLGRLADARAQIAYVGRFDLDTAIAWELKALPLLQQSLGAKHPAVANSLSMLGKLYSSHGDIDKGVALQEQALAATLEQYGAEHPAMIRVYGSLAHDYSLAGDHERALAAREHAAALSKKIGASEAKTAGLEMRVGEELFYLKRPADALQRLDAALAILRASPDDARHDLPQGLMLRAQALQALQRIPEALTAASECVKVMSKVAGPEHPNTAQALTFDGMLLLRRGENRRAVERLERAVSINEKGSGPPAETARARFHLARALWSLGVDKDRARSLAVEAHRDLARVGGEYGRVAQDVEQWLASIATQTAEAK